MVTDPSSLDLGELTTDAITRDFKILQRKRGHRYSLDDVATAWEAVRACGRVDNYLDLGCGIGSVLLMVSWKLSSAKVHGIEALDMSLEIAQRNLALNGLESRATLHFGDHRDQTACWNGPACDLVTGTPPYLPLGTAIASPDPQRAAARIELRGGVEGYLLSASRVVAPKGRVVVCADGRKPERVIRGAEQAGLQPVLRRDIWAREQAEGPLFSVWVLGLDGDELPVFSEHRLVVRDQQGQQTQQAKQMRAVFGM